MNRDARDVLHDQLQQPQPHPCDQYAAWLLQMIERQDSPTEREFLRRQLGSVRRLQARHPSP